MWVDRKENSEVVDHWKWKQSKLELVDRLYYAQTILAIPTIPSKIAQKSVWYRKQVFCF